MNGKKATILVVDDSNIIRNSLKNFFNGYNFEVVSCRDGREGVQKTHEHVPDLIFLDLMMPNFGGLKMLKIIKEVEALKNIPVIVISGSTSRDNVISAIQLGAGRVISKPLQKQILMKTVKDLLGKDFLTKARDINQQEEESDEDKKFVEELYSIFIEEFPGKKQQVVDALESKNKDAIKSVAHELKGVGTSIGYPDITVACREMESAAASENISWENIKDKCEKFFLIVENIDKAKILDK